MKCNHVAARTMEIFRRLGLVRAVRDAGLPAEYPNDVAFRTTATGIGAFAHPDSVSRRALYGEGRPRHLVADTRAAASNQPNLSRTGVVCARCSDAPAFHSEPHAGG